MNIVDAGAGPPLVLIPGIQGRWEWMKRAVDALGAHCRVITFSLADEPSSGAVWRRTDEFDRYVSQVLEAMDLAGVERAAICGVSYGGLIAARVAAQHPERTSSLVLVSALPPGWQPDARVRLYLRAPRLMSPAFMVGSLRLLPEIVAARGGLVPGLVAGALYGITVLAHMFSPTRMARRIALLQTTRVEIGHLETATLIVTGEDGLDRVVPPARTREYLAICPRAEVVVLERTGHLGLITRSEEFARVVASFVERTAADKGTRRRIG